MGGKIALVFSEPVTVKGKPRLRMRASGVADYVSGSGTDTLLFKPTADPSDEVRAVDLNGGAIIACEASATLRPADLSLGAAQKFTTKLSELFRGGYSSRNYVNSATEVGRRRSWPLLPGNDVRFRLTRSLFLTLGAIYLQRLEN
jgi:hypothetical protein